MNLTLKQSFLILCVFISSAIFGQDSLQLFDYAKGG